MKEITLAEFLAKYEGGVVTDIIVVKDKVYGRDSSYDAARWKIGKAFNIVWAAII